MTKCMYILPPFPNTHLWFKLKRLPSFLSASKTMVFSGVTFLSSLLVLLSSSQIQTPSIFLVFFCFKIRNVWENVRCLNWLMYPVPSLTRPFCSLISSRLTTNFMTVKSPLFNMLQYCWEVEMIHQAFRRPTEEL